MSDLRTDSSDYRTELLSPPPLGQKTPSPCDQPSWRLNIDGFEVPARHMNSNFGFVYFVKSLSKLFIHELTMVYVVFLYFDVKINLNYLHG